jgi:HNH endonuclease
MYYPHEADHVIAEKHGGATSADNLAWACFYCNRFKGSDLASVDPTSRDPSSSSSIHVSSDGIAIFASTVVVSRALPPAVALRSLFFISTTLNVWPTVLG